MTYEQTTLTNPSAIPPAPLYIHHWTLRDAYGDVIACGTDDGECAECHLLDEDAMDRYITGLVEVDTMSSLAAVTDENLQKAA